MDPKIDAKGGQYWDASITIPWIRQRDEEMPANEKMTLLELWKENVDLLP